MKEKDPKKHDCKCDQGIPCKNCTCGKDKKVVPVVKGGVKK